MQEKSYKVEATKITVRNNNGSIQLRYQFKGKRQEFNLGLSYDVADNHKIAVAKAIEIHNDIYLFDRYDITRDKYQLQTKKIIKPADELTLKQIWEYYKQFKRDKVRNATKEQWVILDKTIGDFTIKQCSKYFDFLRENFEDSTIKRALEDLSAAINIYISHDRFDGKNPLPSIIKTLEVHRKKINKSFSLEEIQSILEAFKTNPKHNYYYSFIAFRFYTGCRPSEAIGLEWKDIIIQDGKTFINFYKAYVTKSIELGTKDGKDRFFPVNKDLKKLIDDIPKINNLVFPAKKGGYINRKNFSKREWKEVITNLVEQGKIREYLPFYDQRHTFSTLLCRSGQVDLQTISSIVGNSVPTLIKNYIAPNQDINLPTLF